MQIVLNTATKILFLTVIVLGFLFIPCVNATNESTTLCPFVPPVDNKIHEIMEQHYIPSSTVAVIRNNSIIWAKGYGEQQRLDLIYMIASVTKTFTATAIFMLYDQGLIGLNDDVDEHLPFSLRHPNYNETPITITMLLQHMSGLSKDSDQYWYGMMADILDQLGWSNPSEWLPYPSWIQEYLTPSGSLYNESVWISHEPGTFRHYSNFGYDVLGYLIQCVTGQPIWDWFQENILIRLLVTY